LSKRGKPATFRSGRSTGALRGFPTSASSD
jgi:hypothetical protein